MCYINFFLFYVFPLILLCLSFHCRIVVKNDFMLGGVYDLILFCFSFACLLLDWPFAGKKEK